MLDPIRYFCLQSVSVRRIIIMFCAVSFLVLINLRWRHLVVGVSVTHYTRRILRCIRNSISAFIISADGEGCFRYFFVSSLFSADYAKKLNRFFFYRIRGKGGTWVTEETVRFRRLADLKLNQLNEFGLGGGSRAPSASVLVYLLN